MKSILCGSSVCDIFNQYFYNLLLSCAGVNNWIKLQIHLVATIKGFNHSWLSCKIKYKNILKEYKFDKKANEVFGSDRVQECKWYKK